MKRSWRYSRWFLATLLFSIAVLAFTFWPHLPIWHTPVQDEMTTALVGIDEVKRTVLTTKSERNEQKLFVRSMDDGKAHEGYPLLFPKRLQAGEDWPCFYLPEHQFVVACSSDEPTLRIQQVPPAGPPRQLVDPAGATRTDWTTQYGRSVDGGALIQVTSGSSQQFRVWNVCTGELMASTVVPYRHPTGFMNTGTGRLPPELAHLTADRRYLAASISDGTCLLFDLVEDRELLRLDVLGTPRFPPDGQTLVVVPRFGGQGRQQLPRFRLTAAGWTALPDLAVAFAEDEHLFCCGNDWFATARHELPEEIPAWVERVPQVARQILLKLWHRDRIRVRVWDLGQGSVMSTIYIPILAAEGTTKRTARTPLLKDPKCKLKFSNDGQWLAVLHDDQLRLWDVRGRRTLTCWTVCLILTLLAAWLGWPRKRPSPSQPFTSVTLSRLPPALDTHARPA